MTALTQEQIDRQIAMYGCTEESVLAQFDESISNGITILGMLSDAQELMARADSERALEHARQRINAVKLILMERVLEKDEKGRLL